MRILAVSGSLRRDSHNSSLLRAAAEVAPAGVDVELYPADRLAAIPPYNGDVQEIGAPDPVIDLKNLIASADAVLIATPEYNSSIPGQLKNALDWVSRPLAESPLRGKATSVVGASSSAYGAVWAQADLRKVLGALGARVVEAEVAVAHAGDRFDELGRLVDEELREQLAQVIVDLVDAAAPVVLAA